MATSQDLSSRVRDLENRNKKVEANKDWETSWTRRLLIALFTYISIGLYLSSINIKDPWLNAIVPTIGFMLSTLTLPYFKKLWEKYINK